MQSANEEPAPVEAEKRQPKRRMRWWVVALIGLGVAASAYRVTCGTYTNDGPSMEPTLLAGDRFVILRSVWAGDPQPGEVIVARSPFDDIEIVKRVIAVGGQTIEIQNDEIRVDGRPIGAPVECPAPGDLLEEDEPRCTRERVGEREWTVVRSAFSMPEDMPPLTVPSGHVFVMGDHRDRSNDSRNPRIGPVPLESVTGTVLGL